MYFGNNHHYCAWSLSNGNTSAGKSRSRTYRKVSFPFEYRGGGHFRHQRQITLKVSWLRSHTCVHLENVNWSLVEELNFFHVFLRVSEIFLCHNMEVSHAVWSVAVRAIKASFRTLFNCQTFHIRRFAPCRSTFLHVLSDVNEKRNPVVITNPEERFSLNFQKWLSSCLQIIQISVTVDNSTSELPYNRQHLRSRDSISLVKYLNLRWFVPFDLTKLRNFEITVTTFVILRDVWSSCILSDRDSLCSSRRWWSAMTRRSSSRPYLALHPSPVQLVSVLGYPGAHYSGPFHWHWGS